MGVFLVGWYGMGGGVYCTCVEYILGLYMFMSHEERCRSEFREV